MSSSTGTPSLQGSYDQFVADLWIRRTRILCIIAIISIASGIVLDFFLYRNHFAEFVTIRILSCLLLGLLLGTLFTPPARKIHRALGLCWLALPIWHLSLMIAISDGVVSPYYIGNILVIMGASLFLPWTLLECLTACCLTWGMYAAACLANWIWMPGQGDPHGFAAVNNAFFMALFPLIVLAASHFSSQSRYREFKLRFDLDQNKRELELSYQKLSALDHAKSQFFAHISHELRTPLTLILSPLDQLRTSPPPGFDDNLRSTIEIMHGNALRLLSLINDLLDLIRLDEGKLRLDLKPVPLRTLLLGLVDSMRGAAERGQVRLESDLPDDSSFTVQADADRLEKIFINLLFNALKFTPPGGTVRLEGSDDATGVTVRVCDTGIGISETKLDAVFETFWQEEDSSLGAAAGAGIGLALVKQLVELHSGTVEVSSRKGEGATFTVRLPKQLRASNQERATSEPAGEPWLSDLYRKAQRHQRQPSSAPLPQIGHAEPNRAQHTLLLVEDEADMQHYLAKELGHDYNVLIAADGESAYELALAHQPEIILTDLMLPKVDGITLCSRIKSSPSILPSRIILLTARADDRTKLAALEAGADDFVTKPFSMVELKTRLANLLLTSQLERELQNQNQTLEQTLNQLRAAESQLIQTERLSALGNLSAGIMHEINNPVNFMLTATHFLKTQTRGTSDEITETVNDIEGGLRRIRDIIADLKGFAYGSTSNSKIECDPDKILRTSKRLLAQDLNSDLGLEESVEPGTRPNGNENQLVQLIVNLLQNAIHATLSNRSRGTPRKVSIRMGTHQGRYEISVRDNGPGIPKDIQNKVFDPFFTTKPVNEGTGLGLSICHTIVRGHQGRIFATSNPGEGTEFVVQLPAHHSDPLIPQPCDSDVDHRVSPPSDAPTTGFPETHHPDGTA
jgi:signal transduction histidine kinase